MVCPVARSAADVVGGEFVAVDAVGLGCVHRCRSDAPKDVGLVRHVFGHDPGLLAQRRGILRVGGGSAQCRAGSTTSGPREPRFNMWADYMTLLVDVTHLTSAEAVQAFMQQAHACMDREVGRGDADEVAIA